MELHVICSPICILLYYVCECSHMDLTYLKNKYAHVLQRHTSISVNFCHMILINSKFEYKLVFLHGHKYFRRVVYMTFEHLTRVLSIINA